MPSRVVGTINKVAVANFAAAEFPGPLSSGFVAVTVSALSTQRVEVDGVDWSLLIDVPAQYANVREISIFIQRNFLPVPTIPWFNQNNLEENIFHQIERSVFKSADSYNFTRPIVLEAGATYCLLIGLVSSAAIAANVFILGNLRGRLVNQDPNRPLPELR